MKNDWVQGWEGLPEVEREVIAVVGREYRLLRLEDESDDWEAGSRRYQLWVSSDKYGDIVEHEDVVMWKYLEEIPQAKPMPYEMYKRKCGVHASDNTYTVLYAEYLQSFE